MTELERDMKQRIERLTREIEARNAACKQYSYDIACLTDKVRALQVKIYNLTMRQQVATSQSRIDEVLVGGRDRRTDLQGSVAIGIHTVELVG
jgi:hypothetical protein